MKDVVVQIRNPRTDRYVKVNKTAGLITSHKKTAGPYKGIDIIQTSTVDLIPILVKSASIQMAELTIELEKVARAAKIAVKSLSDFKEKHHDLSRDYK